jgi:hypothetical protein
MKLSICLAEGYISDEISLLLQTRVESTWMEQVFFVYFGAEHVENVEEVTERRSIHPIRYRTNSYHEWA